jgi:hypothetical protein
MSLPIVNIINYIKTTLSYRNIKELDLRFSHLDFESGNISLYELFCLSLIVKVMEPSLVMEFGTFNGRTTINIAHNLIDASHIITVDLPFDSNRTDGTLARLRTKFPLANGMNDPNDELGFVGKRKLFENHNYNSSGKIRQVWADTASLDPKHPEWFEKVELIFIDASHTMENCYNDSWLAYEIIKKYGIIIWHDYKGWEGVTKALDTVFDKFGNGYINMFQIQDTSLAVGMVTSKGGMNLW